jgi:hypothetical protein
LITFTSSPKPFLGRDKENQYRAIQNWKRICPDPEIFLYGNADGIHQAGVDLGVRVVSEIDSSPSGLPYFGAIAKHASMHGKYDIHAYVNCDIVFSSLREILPILKLPEFLVIGQRIDLAENQYVDTDPGLLREELIRLDQEKPLALFPTGGSDYFIYKRNIWKNMDRVIIGRGGYDNALIYWCKKKSIPVIDATLAVLAVHHFHGYDHVQGSKKAVYRGDDALQNVKVAGRYSLSVVSDADYIIKNGTLLHWPCRGDRLRCLELKIRHKYHMLYLSLLIRIVWRILTRLKLIESRELNFKAIIDLLGK